jgi:hypothetical protein
MSRRAVGVFAAMAAVQLLAAAEPRWVVGLAETKITPPLGTRMAGFSARQGPSRGVHDDLYVKALLVSRGATSIALATCDLVGLDKAVVQEIRNQAAAQTGIAASNILISATHTHSGPVVGGDYRAFLIRSAVDTIAQAWRSRQPRRIGVGTASHRGWVGMNRRHLESGFSPVDKTIPILRICDSSGRLQAVVFNYSCHPACLGPDNLLISADWPYFVAERIKSKLGRDVKVLFFQGTEGNVNTGYSAGLSAIGVPIPTRTFAYAGELGEILGDAIAAKLPEIPLQEGGPLGSRQELVSLDYYVPSTLEAADTRLEQARRQLQELEKASAPLVRLQAAQVDRAYAEYNRSRVQRNLAAGGRTYPAEIQVFRLGDAGLVSFPGEFFVEIGLEVKRRSPFQTTFCLGLANDSVGYVPTQEAYPEGGYEVEVARFGPQTAQTWADTAIRLLNLLAR